MDRVQAALHAHRLDCLARFQHIMKRRDKARVIVETGRLRRIARTDADTLILKRVRATAEPLHQRAKGLSDRRHRPFVAKAQKIERRDLGEFNRRQSRHPAFSRVFAAGPVCLIVPAPSGRRGQSLLPRLEFARRHPGETAKRARKSLRTVVPGIVRDHRDQSRGIGQPLRGLGEPQALHGLDHAFAG
ncbi:hypothetical protein KCU90_g975, partial [Aureobasidium melanogenum]